MSVTWSGSRATWYFVDQGVLGQPSARRAETGASHDAAHVIFAEPAHIAPAAEDQGHRRNAVVGSDRGNSLPGFHHPGRKFVAENLGNGDPGKQVQALPA